MGNIDNEEMYRVFNMGIGMIVIVPEKEASEIIERLEKIGKKAFSIGYIEKKKKNQPSISFIEHNK